MAIKKPRRPQGRPKKTEFDPEGALFGYIMKGERDIFDLEQFARKDLTIRKVKPFTRRHLENLVKKGNVVMTKEGKYVLSEQFRNLINNPEELFKVFIQQPTAKDYEKLTDKEKLNMIIFFQTVLNEAIKAFKSYKEQNDKELKTLRTFRDFYYLKENVVEENLRRIILSKDEETDGLIDKEIQTNLNLKELLKLSGCKEEELRKHIKLTIIEIKKIMVSALYEKI